MKHHVERTSPKGPGMPFIGVCILCGMKNLKASDALEDCENVRGLSQEQAFLEIISGGIDGDKVYVCDVALVEGPSIHDEAKVIELNAFSSSGLYACDTRKVVKAVSGAALREYLGDME